MSLRYTLSASSSRCCWTSAAARPLSQPTARWFSSSAFRSIPNLEQASTSNAHSPSATQAPPATSSSPSQSQTAAAAPRAKTRARKAALTIMPGALERLQGLSSGPEPKLIRVGVKNKGCAGMSYHLDYVDKPEKWDEVVKQDGVTVVIDSKALFSIIGSEMDWEEGRVESRFVFNNPNVKSECGCKESFSI